jgi:hypothetical protein
MAKNRDVDTPSGPYPFSRSCDLHPTPRTTSVKTSKMRVSMKERTKSRTEPRLASDQQGHSTRRAIATYEIWRPHRRFSLRVNADIGGSAVLTSRN